MRGLAVVLVACTAPRAPASIDVQALLDVPQDVGGTLSVDGTRLLFRSDRDGVMELYVADLAAPTAPATKLVAGPERVASAVFARDGSVIFRRDTGADENFHILRLANGVQTDLTPDDPMWRDSPLLPRARPDLMVYGARKSSDYKSMIVVQELTGAPRVVYRDPGPGTVVDVLPDASRALWYREATTGGHELFEVDLATGAARPISDPEPQLLTTGAYGVDGSIYVATDHGSERHVVERLDRELRVQATYTQADPETAEIASIVPSPAGDRVAVMIDAGNHTMVRVLDAITLAPLGDAQTGLGTTTVGTISETRVRLGTGVFSDDGRRFAIGVSLPDEPDDIYVVDTATGAATLAHAEVRPSLAKLPRVTASIASVPSFDGLAIPVNVHLLAAGKHPVIVWLHGGPDASTPLEWNAWTRVLAAAGYVVLEPNIRGSTGFGRAFARADDREKRVNALRDIEAVNEWARTQPWCDGHLVIAGASFGGYYALMGSIQQPMMWNGAIDIAGPSDLLTMLTRGAMPKRYVEEVGDPVADKDLLIRMSPIGGVERIVAPLFVYQGANDAHVPRAQADTIVRAVRGRGIPVDYMLAGDEGHTVARRANEVELLQRMLRFLADTTRR